MKIMLDITQLDGYVVINNNNEPQKTKETAMFKDILIKVETVGDIDAMVSGEASIPFPSKEMVDKLTDEEYAELEKAILSDNRLFAQNK